MKLLSFKSKSYKNLDKQNLQKKVWTGLLLT